MLNDKDRYGLRDMAEMQLDITSKYTAALVPGLAQLGTDNPWERVALASLRKWDYRLDPESTAALVFHYTLLNLLDSVFCSKLGGTADAYLGITANSVFLNTGFLLRAITRLVSLLDEGEESAWYMDMSSGRERTRSEVLHDALSKAVTQIRRDFGDNAGRWNWGRVHQVRFVHPMGSVRLFRRLFNRGPLPMGGDGTTPNQTSYTLKSPPGLVQVVASYRQIYDLGAWDDAQTVTTTGQSGHPLSDQYDDQIDMWREGAYHKMPWNRAAVEKVTRYKLILEP